MSSHPVGRLAYAVGTAVTLTLTGCSASAPQPTAPVPPPENRAPLPVAPAGGEAPPIPRAFQQPAPLPPQVRSDVPPPNVQVQGGSLTPPGLPPVSLNQLQGILPPQIPLGLAPTLLRPLNQGAFINAPAPGLPPLIGEGCSFGVIPDLWQYGVYPRLLYYPCQAFWVPYILVDNCYYPYVYEPCFAPLWTGCCLYPLLYVVDGCFYPYFFYSHHYYFGYLDWEYNWPDFHGRYSDDWWLDYERHHPRLYGDNDFAHWRGEAESRREEDGGERIAPPPSIERPRDAQERQVRAEPRRDLGGEAPTDTIAERSVPSLEERAPERRAVRQPIEEGLASSDAPPIQTSLDPDDPGPDTRLSRDPEGDSERGRVEPAAKAAGTALAKPRPKPGKVSSKRHHQRN